MKNQENTDDIKKIYRFSGPQKSEISAESEFIKKAIKIGNSAGVLVPRRFLGAEFKIILLKKPLEIKKDVIKLLENYFEEILGVYVTNVSKDLIEILAISSSIRKIIHSGKYKISIVPLTLVKKDIKINPRLKEKLKQARVILNKVLLFELKKEMRTG